MRRIPRPRVLLVSLATVVVLVGGVLGAAYSTHSTKASPSQPVAPLWNHIVYNHVGIKQTPPTTSECLSGTVFGIPIHCYSPAQFQKAYDLLPLYKQGLNGAGSTIVIVDSFGSPTIASDLHVFDQTFGLPDPQLSIIQPAGPVPPFNPGDSTMAGWAVETSLDVEWSHVMAPGANILLVETPVAETEGITGFPEIVKAENYVIDHNLGDVISQSFGATEETFASEQQLLSLRSAYQNAYDHRVTVLGGSGDAGATDYESDGSTLYPFRVSSWPSSDPLVTSVGGTQLNLDDNGNRLSPDVVWNDGFGAGGGGVSEFFDRPGFQAQAKGVVGHSRGTPDISLSAAVDGGVWVYWNFDGSASFYLVGGTSEATPLFAGIVAIADQASEHRLGYLNNRLYRLAHETNSGIVDVTSGNNSFAGVTGYSAGPGYDLASGLGTIDAYQFVREIANDHAQHPNQDDASSN